MERRDRRLLEQLMPMTCDQTWEQLRGDGDRRHCGRCDRMVVRIEDERGLGRAMKEGACINLPSWKGLRERTGAAPRRRPLTEARWDEPPKTMPAPSGSLLFMIAVPVGVYLFFAALQLLFGR